MGGGRGGFAPGPGPFRIGRDGAFGVCKGMVTVRPNASSSPTRAAKPPPAGAEDNLGDGIFSSHLSHNLLYNIIKMIIATVEALLFLIMR
jgi:hypothetical protein